jgi:hypothetical protein
MFGRRERKGVTSAVLTTIVIALVVVAAAGFGLYATKPTATVTATEVMTHTVMVNETEVMSETTAPLAIPFVPQPNLMMAEGIHNAYLFVAPAAGGKWVIQIHAEGLEPTVGTGNVYLVETQEKTGAMAMGPIAMQNATSSEFSVGSDGVGQYFTTLSQNPAGAYEGVEIVLLGGMEMSNATVIATATL